MALARQRHAACIIVGGGSGTRLPGAVEKQFLSLGGMPIVARTALAMQSSPEIASIVLVVPRGREDFARREIAQAFGVDRVAAVVAGGATRAESVRLGLAAVPANVDWILVHDAVRPLATPALVARVLAAAGATGAAIPALRVADTVKRARVAEPAQAAAADAGAASTTAAQITVEETIDRARLWAVQTPQAFGQRTLVDALARAERDNIDAPDCASLVERNGGVVAIVEGETHNIKITTPDDLFLAEAILAARHAKGEGR
ncbi:MAG: 2-C-methyl-D-erythritol 4-phosphate cytidylyltransferase [bacterium]